MTTFVGNSIPSIFSSYKFFTEPPSEELQPHFNYSLTVVVMPSITPEGCERDFIKIFIRTKNVQNQISYKNCEFFSTLFDIFSCFFHFGGAEMKRGGGGFNLDMGLTLSLSQTYLLNIHLENVWIIHHQG